ncbi:type I site-specific deoxyribonuclease HsdR [Brachyspira pilosicoli WesB]|uniref:Type I restriction enzyme endonuclease subunit n=1 Tax=Brachyspira pilosicoli WesB TaxID=1161918 RepID=K0JL57_BRAPL|nr:HsdR family type I site-specific deoxyribonuclease [Brachyspira pilosicoli]CCG57827.1 type I site-specific deoxyribonuclease HsdR [Brachyspira pilosicoli WesB]
MTKQHSERFLQDKVIELFKKLGYKYLTKEEALKERDNNLNNVLLKNILEERMTNFNYFLFRDKKYAFSINNIKKAIEDLDFTLIKGSSTANEKITSKLIEGESYVEKIGDKQDSFSINYIDFKNIENNVFHITEEFEVNRNAIDEKIKTRRPDLVVFINGIPIAVIELKNAVVNVEEAITQMIRNQEQNEIPNLFKFTQLLICANDDKVKYGTLGTTSKFYAVWKDKEKYDYNKSKDALIKNEESRIQKEIKEIIKDRVINDIDITLYSFFQKERFLDILEYFIIFDNGIKKVARYNQYFAIKKIMERIEQTNDEGKREGGVVWHTQGSGKSLIMSMLTKIISRKIKGSKIVVVTDRIELDKQIEKTFNDTGISVKRAKTGTGLINLIKEGATIITTIINKFENVFDKRVVVDSPDIFILVDESHRTQYGDFADKMRKVFPNACYIGFTGTPLYKSEKSTAKKFGGFIDTYTIRDALKDEVIVPLYYESRLPKIMIKDKEAMDNEYDAILEECADTDEEKKIFKRNIRGGRILISYEVLENIVDDIIEHYNKNLKNTKFNAMFAVGSKFEAMRVKEIFDKKNALTTAVIISEDDDRNANTEQKKYVINEAKKLYKDYKDDKNYQEKMIAKFKRGDLDILIVVDKLLTGFDAPTAQVLYIDKYLKDHGLLQAIARVNRTHEGKGFGVLIDYRGLFQNLGEAFNAYDRLANYDLEDIEDTVFDIKEQIEELENSYNELTAFLPQILDENDALDKCVSVLIEKTEREKFTKLFLNYSKVLNICQFSEQFVNGLDSEEISKYKNLFKLCVILRNRLRNKYNEDINFAEYESKMQKLYDEFIGVEDNVKVLTKIPNIFDYNFDEEINSLELEDKADAILNASKNTLKEILEENPELYKRLSERIDEIINDYKNNRITSEEKLELAQEIALTIKGKNEKENIKYDESIRDNKCARSVYDNSKKYIEDENILIDFSLFVDKLFKDKSSIPDWQNMEHIRINIESNIDDKLFELENDKKIEKITGQEMREFLYILVHIGLNIYSNYSDKKIK